MEYKLLAMGKIKFLSIIFLLIFIMPKSQIIKISKSDSTILKKIDELKEDGLTFYKNEYSLIIYNKDNISYNKKNGFKFKEMAGGIRYCEKCKKEYYAFSIKRIKKLPLKTKYQIYSVKHVFDNFKQLQFSGSIFMINKEYYQNLGMPIE